MNRVCSKIVFICLFLSYIILSNNNFYDTLFIDIAHNDLNKFYFYFLINILFFIFFFMSFTQKLNNKIFLLY